jgi:subtilisin family serine protease/subtilisin-like proprotein convertase family protein
MPVNDAPTVIQIYSPLVTQENTPINITVDGYFSDLETSLGGLLYTIEKTTSPGVYVNVVSQVGYLVVPTVSISFDTVGEHKIRVTVFDDGLLTAQQEISVTVDPEYLIDFSRTDIISDHYSWYMNSNTIQNGDAVKQEKYQDQSLMMDTLKETVLGKGIVIGIVDTGMNLAHTEVKNQHVAGESYDLVDGDDNPQVRNLEHGHNVASTIIAEGWNDFQMRGVAPLAKIKAFNYMDAIIDSNLLLTLGGLSQAQDVDVFNQSFGYVRTEYPRSNTSYKAALENGTTNLRNGLGAIYVKSSGNDYIKNSTDAVGFCNGDQVPAYKIGLSCQNTAQNSDRGQIEQIVVGALDVKDKAEMGGSYPAPEDVLGRLKKYQRASFSAAGPGLWVTAPGEFITVVQATNEIYNSIGTSNGTSFSAPITSGIIALMLEVNPNLGWRDVKHIIASTSEKIDPEVSDLVVQVNGADHIAVDKWKQNQAGYDFHHSFGFGMINPDEAVKMAQDYLIEVSGPKGYRNDLLEVALPIKVLNLVVEDNTVTGANAYQDIGTFADQGIDFIESITMGVDHSADNLGDFSLELISPSGTKSIVIPLTNATNGKNTSVPISAGYLTNEFYGENPNGLWRVRLLDTAPTGSVNVNSIQLTISGTTNN